MLLVRLLIGLLKGIVLGAIVGYAIAAAGFVVPGALVAYAAAAALGVLVASVAGKPIWSKGARVEVGMKAVAALLIAPGLLYVARRWLGFELPFDLAAMIGLEPTKASAGMLSLTSFPLVAAVLAGFFEADNDPAAEETQPKATGKAAGARIAARAEPTAPADDLEAEAAEPRTARK